MLPGTVVCYCDNSISLPLLAAYAKARVGKRRLRRLYHERGAMMDRLVGEYQAAIAFRNRRAARAKQVKT